LVSVNGDHAGARNGPHGYLQIANGPSIFWQAWLPANTPVATVVMHHGIAEHSGRYPHAVRALVDAGYAVYAHDARGHGSSEGRRATVDRFEQFVGDL
jgi:acylglycerol lipase